MTNHLGFAKFNNDINIKAAMMRSSKLKKPFKPIIIIILGAREPGMVETGKGLKLKAFLSCGDVLNPN
ncbi:MAG: hypothetical protein KGZ94_09805 [Clostridia bacterium]|nr:hypothetical protein [Clostridia bacterium]